MKTMIELRALSKPMAGIVQLRGYDLGSERDTTLRQVGVLVEQQPQRYWSHFIRQVFDVHSSSGPCCSA